MSSAQTSPDLTEPGQRVYRSSDRSEFQVDGVGEVAPVVYGIQNVIVAVDPRAYEQVAPLYDDQFLTTTAAAAMDLLVAQPDAVLLNADFAEYVTLRAQGLQPRAIRLLISAEAGTAAIAGCLTRVSVGLIMAFYLINVLRPLFVLTPPYHVPLGSTFAVVASVLLATAITSVPASSLVNRLRATELLRDE